MFRSSYEEPLFQVKWCDMQKLVHEPWINRIDIVDPETQIKFVLAALETERNPLTKFMMRLEIVICGLRLQAVRPLTCSQISFHETRPSVFPRQSAPDAL
jgi:hypothetical protein